MGAEMTFGELRQGGVLWAVNKVLFHPRGFALAFHWPEGATAEDVTNGIVEPTGVSLEGDGSEPWSFTPEVDDEQFKRFEKFLDDHRPGRVKENK